MSLVTNKPKLYKDIVGVICSFLPKYKLLDWVDEKKIHFPNLCLNPSPGAIEMIEKELRENSESKKIYWKYLCINTNAIHLIEKELKENPDSKKINWCLLCENPNAVHLIEEELKRNPNSQKIDWCFLSTNPNAVHIIEKNLDKFIHEAMWSFSYANPNIFHLLENKLDNLTCCTSILYLLKNPNPKAFQAIKQKLNINKEYCIHAMAENTNPEVLNLIENFEYIYRQNELWFNLSKNPSAIHLLENRLNEVDWRGLAMNPKAIHILEKASSLSSLLNYNYLSQNPAIFEPSKLIDLLLKI